MDFGVWISECSREKFREFIDVENQPMTSEELYLNSNKYIIYHPFHDRDGRIGLYYDRLVGLSQLVYISYAWTEYCSPDYINKVSNKLTDVTGNRTIFTNPRSLVFKDNITRDVLYDVIHDIWENHARSKELPQEMIELIFRFVREES